MTNKDVTKNLLKNRSCTSCCSARDCFRESRNDYTCKHYIRSLKYDHCYEYKFDLNFSLKFVTKNLLKGNTCDSCACNFFCKENTKNLLKVDKKNITKNLKK